MFRDMTGSKDSLGIGKVVLILISKSRVVNEVPGRRKHSQQGTRKVISILRYFFAKM